MRAAHCQPMSVACHQTDSHAALRVSATVGLLPKVARQGMPAAGRPVVPAIGFTGLPAPYGNIVQQIRPADRGSMISAGWSLSDSQC
jgi:hypothetical protein